jgi:hypothetical protein
MIILADVASHVCEAPGGGCRVPPPPPAIPATGWLQKASDLPLALLSLMLVSLYIALAALACRYWRYLKKRNGVKAPVEPRWTLALVDKSTGFQHNIDLDGHDLDLNCKKHKPDLSKSRMGCFTLSLRAKIEEITSKGRYLGFKDAQKAIQSERIISDFGSIWGSLRSSSTSGSASQKPNSGVDELSNIFCAKKIKERPWTLAPLALLSSDDEIHEIDISELRPQIESVISNIVTGNYHFGEAQRRIEALSLAPVFLAPAELVFNEEGRWGTKVAKTFCCNRITEPNVKKNFTSYEYTKGENINQGCLIRSWNLACRKKRNDRPGDHLPWKVTGMTTFVGSCLLFATWVAFYPGWVVDRNAANCKQIPSDRLCKPDRVAYAVQDIEAKTREVLKFTAASDQVEQAILYQTRMKADVQRYQCVNFATNKTENVSFPHWCADARQEQMNKRRVCCSSFPVEVDVEFEIQDKCHYFDPSGLDIGATRVCLHEFPDLDLTPTATGSTTANGMDHPDCVDYSVPCNDDEDGMDDEQDALKDYIEAKARRWISSPEVQATQLIISDEVTDFMSEVLITFKNRVDAASDFYIAYCVARLWFPTPLLICRTAFLEGIKRALFGLSKRTFVIYIVLLWWLWDFGAVLIEYLEDPEINVYIRNIAGDPCFVDRDFLNNRLAKIGEVCSQLKNMSRTVEHVSSHPDIRAFNDVQVVTAGRVAAQANGAMTNMYADIVAFGPTPMPAGCG